MISMPIPLKSFLRTCLLHIYKSVVMSLKGVLLVRHLTALKPHFYVGVVEQKMFRYLDVRYLPIIIHSVKRTNVRMDSLKIR